MTATSLVALAQSSRDSRFPGMISVRAPGASARIARRRSRLLDGRTKQRRFEKPERSNISTTLEPMKPFEPVINIGASDSIIKLSAIILRLFLVSTSESMLGVNHGPLGSERLVIDFVRLIY